MRKRTSTCSSRLSDQKYLETLMALDKLFEECKAVLGRVDWKEEGGRGRFLKWRGQCSMTLVWMQRQKQNKIILGGGN